VFDIAEVLGLTEHPQAGQTAVRQGLGPAHGS
jgi:hypothetical protein